MAFSLNHVHLKTPDPKATADWYIQNLGATVTAETPAGGFRLDLHGLPLNVTDHIATLQTEENILDAAEQRLDVLEAGDRSGRTLGQIASLVRDCRERHVDLHDQLMRARNVFLDEHARQAFTTAPLLPRPDLLSEVLEPVLHMGRREAREVTDQAFPGFFGAHAPSTLSFVALIEWQLRPRREPPASEVPVDERDLTLHAMDLDRYPPEVRARAEALLAGL